MFSRAGWRHNLFSQSSVDKVQPHSFSLSIMLNSPNCLNILHLMQMTGYLISNVLETIFSVLKQSTGTS